MGGVKEQFLKAFYTNSVGYFNGDFSLCFVAVVQQVWSVENYGFLLRTGGLPTTLVMLEALKLYIEETLSTTISIFHKKEY